jgi:hypothetical protein
MTASNRPLTAPQYRFVENAISGFDRSSWGVETAGNAGSERTFYRLRSDTHPGRSYVLVVWDSSDEDWGRFFAINREVGRHNRLLPEIIASDETEGLILEEDAGRMTLKDFYNINATDTDALFDTYCRVIDELIRWQSMSGAQNDTINCRSMDRETLLWETDYFARHCVGELYNAGQILTDRWNEECDALAEEVSEYCRVPMHRDFQSENIILSDQTIKLVDYQGARMGPPGYDLASLLYDPYVTVMEAPLRLSLLSYYRSRSAAGMPDMVVRRCAMQRLMQALGAYANLWLNKGKAWYRNYIPCAFQRLLEISMEESRFPAIRTVVSSCIEQQNYVL